MKATLAILLLGLISPVVPAAIPSAPPAAALAIREIHYAAQLTDELAKFTLDISAEATGPGESALKLLEGDLAVLPPQLPDSLKLRHDHNRYQLVATRPGHYRFNLEIVAKIQSAEPWNQVSFTGPAATIASIVALAGGTNTEIQLSNGTLLESFRTNGVSGVKGFLGADPAVGLRWQGQVATVSRKALLTADSTLSALVTPTVIKYSSQFHYAIVQGTAAQLTLALPAAQTLTRLDGKQIRDWHTVLEGERQVLTVQFIKPVETQCDLTLYSEQTVAGAAEPTRLTPPQPLNVERESGSLAVSAEDTLVEVASCEGLRQVNAPDNAVVAYHFSARPFALGVTLKAIEPDITVADRVHARLEETRLLVTHSLALTVKKAGVYALELLPAPGFAVADVRGPGLEDWKAADGRLTVNFSQRVLGQRPIEVQLEQSLKTFPEQIGIAPLRVTGAARETAQIGALAVPGIRLKTAAIAGLREIPAGSLTDRTGDILAYTSEQSDWHLAIGTEKLAARVVAEVFNLVTIGDGQVGGSATLRYSLVSQGAQEFKVRVPAACKNVEFTGANIRRKEQSGEIWTLGLQDKVWGGYTLVVTYDYPFDAQDATLPLGGIHAVAVERETGSIAVTTAASLQLAPQTVSDTLRRVDESELSAADRSLITRAVVLAWQYAGDQYDLAVGVKRFAEQRVLEAVADRTQITSVLTGTGEMLTQASFMVKNNEKQFQRFQLPPDAKLWGCSVNGQPAKPERDGNWLMLSLPRDANRDQAFAVDLMYAQTNGVAPGRSGRELALAAPRTDVPNTYAEWQIFVPPTLRLSDFGGNMNVTAGTTYELLDAWGKFLHFYGEVLREAGGAIFFIGSLAVLVFLLVISAVRRGWNGVLTLLATILIIAVLGAMLLPALSAAKKKAQKISSVNNMKQIGLAIRMFANDHNDRMPASFEEMKNELSTDKITYDPDSGQRYIYIGANYSQNQVSPESVIAYSVPNGMGYSVVGMADGSVQCVTAQGFAELFQRGLILDDKGKPIAPRPGETPAQNPVAVGGAAPVAQPAPSTASPASPMVSGIRSLRIELPQTGLPYLFTKVLNLQGEPLSIRAQVIPESTFQTLQMLWQTAIFLLGLALGWHQWHRPHRSSLVLTLALTLMLGSVGSLLIQWRALHDALIIGFPMVMVAVIAMLVWRFWPRSSQAATDYSDPTDPSSGSTDLPGPGFPPVMAALALAFILIQNPASAAPASESREPQPVASARIPKSDIQSSCDAPSQWGDCDAPVALFQSGENPRPKTGDEGVAGTFLRRGVAATLNSAAYSGRVNDRVATLEATLRFADVRENESLPLFGNEVVLQDYTVQSGRATLVRDREMLRVRFERAGEAILKIRLLVNLSGDVTKRRLAFAIPSALSSRMAVTLNQPEAEVDFPGAITFKRVAGKESTGVDALLGNAGRVELLWTPRVKRAEEVAATVFCRNRALATLGNGVVNVHSTLNYQITQGELRQARVRLPAGYKLLRVEGRDVRTWEIRENTGEAILVVDLLKGVAGAWQLSLETERVLAALPATAAVELPRALEVKRENGWVALRGAEELGLTVTTATGLERVDAEEFIRAGSDPTGPLTSVFRFTNPDFSLRIRAEAIRPQIEAVVRNVFRVGAEQVALSASVNYTIKKAGVFHLRLALPAGYRVEHVSGSNVQQQVEQNLGDSRFLEVTLKDRISGSYNLVVDLISRRQPQVRLLTMAGVHPLDIVKLTGFIAISAEPGVAVKTETFDGLTEIPAAALADVLPLVGGGNWLAFKYITPEPQALPEWKLRVTTETVAAWVRAETVNQFTLAESLVSGRALVRYDIGNAPVKELRVAMPPGSRNVEISGPNIRSREQNGTDWRVELQSPLRGLGLLTVTWDEPRSLRTNAVVLTGVTALNVERETGYFVVSAKAPLQVSEALAGYLQRVDTADLPDWAALSSSASTLAYRHIKPGVRLGLEVRRFEDAAVLEALVDAANFTSVIAEDGQMMTEMTLSVRNNGRQFLEIELPAHAQAWSAFVAGQPVRPSLRDGKLLVPIQSSDDAAMSVELTYVGTNAFPKIRGDLGFASPKLDIPLKNARWEVYLPPDYLYQDLQRGTMSRELAAAQPWSASFSILDYSRMEQASKASARSGARQDVSAARQQLAGGNVREATANLIRARAKDAGKDNDAEVKKLADDLKTVQASNLIHAQNDFYFRTAGNLAGDENRPIPANPESGSSVKDNLAAGEQWTKLQQAQEIVTTKVQPLRVNLPVRGQRFAFAQVLQTEGGKPMTFGLTVENARRVHWPARLAGGAMFFLALWAAVALLLRRPQAEA